MVNLVRPATRVGWGERVKFHEARRHFASGGEVLISEDRDQPSIPVFDHSTTHTKETTTWEALAEAVHMWRNRYPYQRWYIVRRDVWFIVVARSTLEQAPIPPYVVGPYFSEDTAKAEAESECGLIQSLVTVDAKNERYVVDDCYWTQKPPVGERIIPPGEDTGDGD